VRPTLSIPAWLRRKPVRLRLAVVSGGLTAVILITFAIVVGRLVKDRIEDDFRDELRGTANALAFNIRVAEDSGDGARVGFDLQQVAMANDAVIRIVDGTGEPVRGEFPAGAPEFGPPRTQEIAEAPGSLRVASALIFTNTISGEGPLYVQYALSRAPTDATIDRLWLFLIGGVLGGTLLAVAAGMAVARGAMRPIADLTSTARAIATTRDPSMRIPEPESDDEVAELARTLEQMLRELDAARTETEATVQRQREFVADASHELRTPLTSILANLELLEDSLQSGNGTGDGDDHAAARSALRSSRRMSRLVADLLIIARADAGRRGEPAVCDLSSIAAEAFEEVRPVAGERALEAAVEPGATVSGNADELHRMILNLLENAIRHTPEGTTVRLDLSRDGSEAVIEVSDDGPGLPAGMEAKVFQRFVRGAGPADSAGAGGLGTGLGLSIVRAVATVHGGSVEAGSAAAGGASFVVRIPLAGD
jgi:signal transduction histidine kinase